MFHKELLKVKESNINTTIFGRGTWVGGINTISPALDYYGNTIPLPSPLILYSKLLEWNIQILCFKLSFLHKASCKNSHIS